MSTAAKQTSRREVVGPDGAKPTGIMRLTGVVRTTKGFAVAMLTVTPVGSTDITLGPSQAFPEHVAREHQRIVVNATMKAQAGK